MGARNLHFNAIGIYNDGKTERGDRICSLYVSRARCTVAHRRGFRLGPARIYFCRGYIEIYVYVCGGYVPARVLTFAAGN